MVGMIYLFITLILSKRVVFNYIEMFYNRKRRHETLGYVSPVVYEEIYEMNQERAA